MQSVPKIVRDRLQAAPPAVNHPDADLLTAFAEQSLRQAERATVLDHLSRCADCRDVVALALPATEALETVAIPVRSGWLTWPALRWGFVAAGVVVITGIGFLHFQQRPAMMAYKSPELAVPESRSQASVPAEASPAATQVENQDKIAATPSAASPVSRADAAVREPKGIAPAAPPPAATRGNASHGAVGGTFGGPLVYNRKVPLQWQSNNAQQQLSNNPFQAKTANQQGGAASPAPQVPRPSNETVEVTGESPVVNTLPQNQLAKLNDQSAGAREEYADKISVSKTKLPVNPAAPGQVLGYVVDPSGAVVPNARITITPTAAGKTATAVTNSQGVWLIAGLSTGNYKAQAEAPGFNPTVLAFSYDANQPSTYKLTLSPGSVSEVVEVSSAQSPQAQTEPTNMAGSITNRDVSQIPVNGRVLAQLTALSAGPLPRWTISSSGTLQRSFDQGRSWQSVDVNAGGASGAAAGASFEAVAKASRAKETEKDADKKSLKRQPAAPTFRVVTAAGLEVWAGGSSGVLYHSLDAGSHWTRVVPASAGSILTGDVVSLEFPDPQHGKITTSAPEVWTTSDAGQTWQKQ